MKKTEKLNNLFMEWENSRSEYRGRFFKDGIISEDDFEKQIVKILFITKEPNNSPESNGDFRSWWGEEVKWGFSNRIFEWAYGILYDFPVIETISTDQDTKINTLRQISFMNLKKTAGCPIANYNMLKIVIEQDADFIRREVEIIEPTLIIGGIGSTNFWSLFLKGITFHKSGYDRQIGKWKQIKIIDFYHPSYRVPRSMSYSLLKEIINSDSYANT